MGKNKIEFHFFASFWRSRWFLVVWSGVMVINNSLFIIHIFFCIYTKNSEIFNFPLFYSLPLNFKTFNININDYYNILNKNFHHSKKKKKTKKIFMCVQCTVFYYILINSLFPSIVLLLIFVSLPIVEVAFFRKHVQHFVLFWMCIDFRFIKIQLALKYTYINVCVYTKGGAFYYTTMQSIHKTSTTTTTTIV